MTDRDAQNEQHLNRLLYREAFESHAQRLEAERKAHAADDREAFRASIVSWWIHAEPVFDKVVDDVNAALDKIGLRLDRSTRPVVDHASKPYTTVARFRYDLAENGQHHAKSIEANLIDSGAMFFYIYLPLKTSDFHIVIEELTPDRFEQVLLDFVDQATA